MMTLFWDSNGIIHNDHLLHVATMSGEHYANMLERVFQLKINAAANLGEMLLCKQKITKFTVPPF